MNNSYAAILNILHLLGPARDTKPFPHEIPCMKCKYRNGRGKGKSKLFKTPRAKFYHLHSLAHHLDRFDKPTLDDELEVLEALSIANQCNILSALMLANSWGFLKNE